MTQINWKIEISQRAFIEGHLKLPSSTGEYLEGK